MRSDWNIVKSDVESASESFELRYTLSEGGAAVSAEWVEKYWIFANIDSTESQEFERACLAALPTSQ